MSKPRPFIPPPVITPPVLGFPACAACAARSGMQRCPHPPVAEGVASALAVVPPLAKVSGIAVGADRIEYTNPTIKLAEHIFLNRRPGDPLVQADVLSPARAYVAHGMLVIEELGISLPLDKVTIIRTPKEAP